MVMVPPAGWLDVVTLLHDSGGCKRPQGVSTSGGAFVGPASISAPQAANAASGPHTIEAPIAAPMSEAPYGLQDRLQLSLLNQSELHRAPNDFLRRFATTRLRTCEVAPSCALTTR
jgi:hypothetical protein